MQDRCRHREAGRPQRRWKENARCAKPARMLRVRQLSAAARSLDDAKSDGFLSGLMSRFRKPAEPAEPAAPAAPAKPTKPFIRPRTKRKCARRKIICQLIFYFSIFFSPVAPVGGPAASEARGVLEQLVRQAAADTAVTLEADVLATPLAQNPDFKFKVHC